MVDEPRTMFKVLILILMAVSIFLILPYITYVMMAIILTYLLYPVYEKLNKVVRHDTTSSFLVVVLTILILIIPSIFMMSIFLTQARGLLVEIKISTIQKAFDTFSPLVKISAESVFINLND